MRQEEVSSVINKNGSRMSVYAQNMISINTDYNYIKGSYSDNFEEATKLLKQMVTFESENMHIIKASKKKRDSVSIVPTNLNDPHFLNYCKTKIRYKELFENLLATRSAFTKKMKIDITSTIHTIQNVEPNGEDWVVVS